MTKTSEIVQISEELEQVIQSDCPLFFKTYKEIIEELLQKTEKAKALLEQRDAVDDCIICQGELKASHNKVHAMQRFKLECGHDLFHRKCLFNWLKTKR
jgi:5'-deoxynucleotidase YfbR-like HD superfamily hydrolase